MSASQSDLGTRLGPDSAANGSLLDHPARAWPELLSDLDLPLLIRAAVRTISELTLPLWTARYPSNRTPARALEAAEQCLRRGTDDARQHALVLAKACTNARAVSLGYTHRTAEAARGVALAAAQRGRAAAIRSLADAYGGVEDELIYQDSIDAIYGREPEIRRRMLDVVRPILLA